jgi:arginyl-tRNA synthetase
VVDLAKIELTSYFKKALEESFSISLEDTFTQNDLYKFIGFPPNPELGNYCFELFRFSKILKKSPVQIAQTLAQYFNQNISSYPALKEASQVGPYLNIFVNFHHFLPAHFQGLNEENNFDHKKIHEKALSFLPELKSDISGQKIMIEYSQPNTHKELHVGHMRNLCLGDSIIKCGQYLGEDILSATFPGDVGTHVAKCLWYLKYHYLEQAQQIPETDKGTFLGEIYAKANFLLEEQKETRFEQNKEQLTQILKQLEQKSGEFYDLWQETRQWSLDLMKQIYSWSGVNFDVWFYESQVDTSSVELIKDYHQKGVFVESDGAIGCDLSEEKLGFCLLIKSDGNGLYATKDIELARRKFQDHKIDRNIYVVDKRQSLHFKQVFKSLEKMGFEKASQCYHLAYDFVELPDGAMSSRKGNVVPITRLIKNMQEMISKNYLERYRGIWSDQEIDDTSDRVAAAAIKYGMLRIDSQKKIVFDINEWLRLDGESGPYILYAYARIQSIMEKTQMSLADAQEIIKQDQTFKLKAIEQKIYLSIFNFNQIVQSSWNGYRPSLLCSYLYELAKLYASFYVECPISKADRLDQAQRILLSNSVAQTLRVGLGLLGIKTVSRM